MPDEMMIIAAARLFRNRATCFVGVGQPSAAACVARLLHAPDAVLVYESGVIGAKPSVPPLSVADPELAATADFTVGLPEIFNYWIQAGRIDIAFLGAAQVDRFGNVNSTAIGAYRRPRVRLPGAGGAPEIALGTREVVVIVKHSPRVFVSKADFITTRLQGKARLTIVTDLAILQPERAGEELRVVRCHPGASIARVQAATGWPIVAARAMEETLRPSTQELLAVRAMDTLAKSAA